MNYLAHGFRHLADPWFLAGTAVPDWARLLDRRARVSWDAAAPWTRDADSRTASLARGVQRHHDDDRRFHGSAAFDETRRAVADLLRPVLPEAEGHRPWFVSHLVVEVLLDASLADEDPALVDRYYAALAAADAEGIEARVRTIEPSVPAGLARLVRGFLRERFLADYTDAGRAAARIGRVVARVGLPRLPPGLAASLPRARGLVEARRDELLGPRSPDRGERDTGFER